VQERAGLEAARQSVVSIFYDYGGDGDGGQRSGSGFLVDRRLVVTDYHVVWGRPRFLTLVGPDGRLGPRGRLDTVSPSYDLALIVLEEEWKAGPPLPLATGVDWGSPGFALAGRWVPTACSRHVARVSVERIGFVRQALQPTIGGTPVYPTEMLFLPPGDVCRGFSGGPVLNMRGEVMGVIRGFVGVEGRRPGPDGLHGRGWVVATSARHVREALAAHRREATEGK
jgi:S1-C subfamily serine protease